LNSLDTQIFIKKCYYHLFIEDLRNDERIEYLSGKQSRSKKQKIDQGEFEIGLLFPSNIEK
jgi:uncharacterized protein (DUF1015 family)